MYLLTALLLCCSCPAAACVPREAPSASGTEFFFDTSVTIKVYGEQAEECLQACFTRCRELEHVFSAELADSELYRLNHRSAKQVEVSDALRDCIALGLQAGIWSGGEFDITIYPVTKCWDFRSGEGSVPEQAVIDEALSHVDASRVQLQGNTVIFEDPDTMIDLGAIAKGYISAELKALLKSMGAAGAVINLGGNISTFGSKTSGQKDGGPLFRIGIQKPFAARGATELTAALRDACVISSGTYERYFEADGRHYHHILSAKNGFPKDCGLSQVTLLGTDDALMDTLSTVCMLCGREEAEELLRRENLHIMAVFTDDSGKMTLFTPEAGESELRQGQTIEFR